MPPGSRPDDGAEQDLRFRLEAEQAATEHWRRIAEQRSAEYADLRHRRFVRAVLLLERRAARFRRPLARLPRWRRRVMDRSGLALRAVGRRSRHRVNDLRSTLAGLPAPPPIVRSVTLIVVGSSPPDLSALGAGDPLVQIQPVPRSADATASVARAIDAAGSDIVGVLLSTSEPLAAGWLGRLAACITGSVVGATPVLVHPWRPLGQATPHDGKVRAAGLELDVTAELVPEVRSLGAGCRADPSAPPVDVDAASAACLVLDRVAYEAAGGLAVAEDLEVAVVDLCRRLRAAGGGIVAVPGAALLDHRRIEAPVDLRTTLTPTGQEWRGAIDRRGPALLRAARPLPSGTLRVAITTSPPSRKVAHRWGDWHLANGLGDALRRLGHEVRVQTADEADHPAGRACDVHLVLRGLHPVRRTPGQRHVLWIISHPEAIDDEDLDAADLVLVASPTFAEHLRGRCTTPVHEFLQATDQHRFRPLPVDPALQHPITVVAKTRDVVRPIVADAVAAGLRPSIFGGGWQELVDPALVVAEHIDHDQLPSVYSSAGVVLNDHWRTMQAWGFISNRLFDVLACGTPVISDAVPGIAEVFDGGVVEYTSRDELRQAVDSILADPAAARARAERGRARVLAAHTFDHRAAELLRLLGELPDPGQPERT